MCQPGRPGPQGESQLVSSPSLCAFHSAKSSRSSFRRGRAGLLALVHVLGAAVGELPVAGEAADPEVDVSAGLVGVPGLDQLGDQRDDPADRLGGQRLGVRPAQPEPVGVLEIGLRSSAPRTPPRARPPLRAAA